jgi:hypothetical protein
MWQKVFQDEWPMEKLVEKKLFQNDKIGKELCSKKCDSISM